MYTYSLFIIVIYILDFEKRVFRELHVLSLKMDDISEAVNVIIKKRANEVHNPEYNEVSHIIQSFSVNENSLMELENWLMSSDQNKTIRVKNFHKIRKLRRNATLKRSKRHQI